MIRYFRRTEKTVLKHLEHFEPGTWAYAEAPTMEETEHLIPDLGLDAGHIADAMDTEEVPRLEREGEQLYFFTRLPFTNDEMHLETAPILFVITPKFLLTLSARPLPHLDSFIDGSLTFSTAQPDQLMMIILDKILNQYATYLNQVSRQIKAIRTRLSIETISNRDFVDFVLVEDELNEVLSSLTPTNAILKRLLINKHLKLTQTDQELMEDLVLETDQLIEAAKSNTKSITNIREAYSSLMTNNLNRVIRMLTLVTVLLSILTVIAGLYGMNVKLPFSEYKHAFSFVVGSSLLIVAILLWLFRRKKWL